MKTTILFSIIVLSLFSCCQRFSISKSDHLNLKKKEYTGNQLRTDGYYYQYYNNKYFGIMIFYQDGTILIPDGVKESTEQMDNYIINSFVKNGGYEKVLYRWGVFNIDADNIAFERWYPSEAPYKAYISEGKIINNTTFLINKRYKMVDSNKHEIEDMDDEYHFRQFSPKPDSTNTFMDDFLKSARASLQHFDISQ